MPDAATALAQTTAAEFRRRMQGEYLPRIRRCLDLLPESAAWQRPTPTGNSVGNLLLHLEGNVRQWILAGVGGQPDHRDRDSEFQADAIRVQATSHQLHERLSRTVEEACAVVDRLTPTDFLATRTFQDRWQETVLTAVLHVLEHFSGHAGQIYAWTKQVTGLDLRFYDL